MIANGHDPGEDHALQYLIIMHASMASGGPQTQITRSVPLQCFATIAALTFACRGSADITSCEEFLSTTDIARSPPPHTFASGSNAPLTKRFIKHVLPTPDAPTRITLNLRPPESCRQRERHARSGGVAGHWKSYGAGKPTRHGLYASRSKHCARVSSTNSRRPSSKMRMERRSSSHRSARSAPLMLLARNVSARCGMALL